MMINNDKQLRLVIVLSFCDPQDNLFQYQVSYWNVESFATSSSVMYGSAISSLILESRDIKSHI